MRYIFFILILISSYAQAGVTCREDTKGSTHCKGYDKEIRHIDTKTKTDKHSGIKTTTGTIGGQIVSLETIAQQDGSTTTQGEIGKHTVHLNTTEQSDGYKQTTGSVDEKTVHVETKKDNLGRIQSK